jgi:ElaB/YqjD/DUF883 family membrane-anchored ribosome-binding protein
MGDDRTAALPDGTDTVIEGAARIDDGGTATVEDTALVTEREIPAPKGDAERPVTGSGSPEGGLAGSPSGSSASSSSSGSSAGSGSSGAQGIIDRLRGGREQLTSQAGERARGLVSQGLERTAEALANVSKMVGDTAPGIEERLGPEYGDYARRAAGSIENVANSIASKDPDELIDDTRNFVRESPGIALAGAAVVGFVVARLLKTGLAANNEDDEES